jgi:hypothetical protein
MAYTDIDNPELYFQTKLYTGDGNSTQAITLDGSENMQPDWIWIKNRTDGHYHNLNDSVRGVGAAKVLRSNTNGAEGGTSGHVSVIGSDGFTVAAGTSDSEEVNTSSDNYVAWNWKAGTSFTNDASSTGVGTIDSTGSINTTAGFSIISYTGTGSNGTIAHGLSSAPQVVLLKERNGTNNWLMSHQPLSASLGDYTRFMTLNSTAAVSGAGNIVFQGSAFTSSVFNVGASAASNGSSQTFIAYCFAEKKGYSKFGSYTGNGNTDGTFVYTGFKPAWVMSKYTTGGSAGGEGWNMFDNKRDPFNIVDLRVQANSSSAESSSTNHYHDFLSNGFKLRTVDGSANNSGATYIYMAFAESPFVNSSGVPNNAR